MPREKIAEFQSRLAGLTLGHGTHEDQVASILEKGLTGSYNYACVDEGWEMHEGHHVNLLIDASVVADRTYPDPEGQWGEHFDGYSMEMLVEKLGSLDAALDELERCMRGEGWIEDFEDVLDPKNYNLVIVGAVPASAIKKEKA